MDRLKLVSGAVLALTEAGLQVSGITNIVLALILWGLAAILLIWGAWHPFKTNLLPLLSQWRLQWPLARKAPLPEALAPPTKPAAAPLQMALYVGHFWADFTHIKDEMYFTITIRIFNQMDQNITIESVRGNLVFERFTKMAAVSLAENLPLTVVAHHHDGATVTIRQGVNAGELLQRLAGAKVQQGCRQKGPRYRGPFCLSRFF
jgi:hypothetical protein